MTSTSAPQELELPLTEWVNRAQGMPNLIKRVPKWQTQITSVNQGHACYWCGQSGLTLGPDHIIAPGCGGTNATANVVVSCKTCARRKGAHDALAWCNGQPEKLKRRLAALESGLCHPLVEPIRDKGTVRKHLERRWAHERFTVYLGASHLLWPCVSPVPAHVLVVLRSMGATVQDVGRWKAATLSTRLGEALDMLVSCNALVRALDGTDGPLLLQSGRAVCRFQASFKTAAGP